MQTVKTTLSQQAILKFIADGHAPFVSFYNGPHGDESGRHAGYFWKAYDRTKTPPKPRGQAINGLIHRGLLTSLGDGDYGLTDAGRASISAFSANKGTV